LVQLGPLLEHWAQHSELVLVLWEQLVLVLECWAQ
jgi:hypothetical protein